VNARLEAAEVAHGMQVGEDAGGVDAGHGVSLGRIGDRLCQGR
jgi:hypothetical protein